MQFILQLSMENMKWPRHASILWSHLSHYCCCKWWTVSHLMFLPAWAFDYNIICVEMRYILHQEVLYVRKCQQRPIEELQECKSKTWSYCNKRFRCFLHYTNARYMPAVCQQTHLTPVELFVVFIWPVFCTWVCCTFTIFQPMLGYIELYHLH